MNSDHPLIPLDASDFPPGTVIANSRDADNRTWSTVLAVGIYGIQIIGKTLYYEQLQREDWLINTPDFRDDSGYPVEWFACEKPANINTQPSNEGADNE